MVTQTPYHLLGENKVRQLVKAFYKIMDEDPSANEIRTMHQASLSQVEEKLFEYLSGWLGGPQLYQEKYGTVCITSAHKLFTINNEARDQWLYCMNCALEKIECSQEVKKMLEPAFFDVANFLVNSK